MKPIQVTIQKPEPEDWDQDELNRFHWVSPTGVEYLVNEEIKGSWHGSFTGYHKNLPEAQEACFQHYLKEIGAEK